MLWEKEAETFLRWVAPRSEHTKNCWNSVARRLSGCYRAGGGVMLAISFFGGESGDEDTDVQTFREIGHATVARNLQINLAGRWQGVFRFQCRR